MQDLSSPLGGSFIGKINMSKLFIIFGMYYNNLEKIMTLCSKKLAYVIMGNVE